MNVYAGVMGLSRDLCRFPVRGGHDERSCQRCNWKNARFQPIQCSSLGAIHQHEHIGADTTIACSEFFHPGALGGRRGCGEGNSAWWTNYEVYGNKNEQISRPTTFHPHQPQNQRQASHTTHRVNWNDMSGSVHAH